MTVSKKKSSKLVTLTLGMMVFSGAFANPLSLLNAVGVSAASSTQQQIADAKSQLNDLAQKLTQNTIDSANLAASLAGRKGLVEDQMRSLQLNSQFANRNILYQLFINHLSLEQAVAMTRIIGQSIDNIALLKKDEATLAQEKKDISEQEAQIQVMLDTLYSKYSLELADAEAAKQATLAAQTEAAKIAAPAATPSNSINVALPGSGASSPASLSSSSSSSSSASSLSSAASMESSAPASSMAPASTDWSAWPPAVAAQYVSNGTGVSAQWWLTILYRESGGNPTAVNPSSGTYGYFQMNGPAHGGVNYQAMTPQQYLDAVIGLYHSQGAGAWSETDY